MAFAQSDGLTGCYRFAPSRKCQYHLFGLCRREREKKTPHHWSLRSVQVALQRRATTIGNMGWNAGRNVRQPLYGPVGHLSASHNCFWRHMVTDLWPQKLQKPPLLLQVSRTRAQATTRVKIKCVFCSASASKWCQIYGSRIFDKGNGV